MYLNEEIKKILKENIDYISNGESIDEEEGIDKVVELLMQEIRNHPLMEPLE